MKTTLNKIKSFHPCSEGWVELLKSLDKTQADDEELSFKAILEYIGIEDAVWCLRTVDYRDYCLFLADIAESVLPIYESKHPENNAPRKAIEAVRNYHNNRVSLKDLSVAAYTAYTAAYAADAAAAAAAAAAYTAYAADARKEKWDEIESLFVKYFCG